MIGFALKEKNIIVKILMINFLLFVFTVGVISQIYSPDNHITEKTIYTINGKSDSIYIFNVPVYGEKLKITLGANSFDINVPCSFFWYRYNANSNQYELIKSENGLLSKIDTISSDGGYRLIREKDGVRDTCRVWVYFNDFNIRIVSKDEQGNLPHVPPYTTCKTLNIVSDIKNKTFTYYNPLSGNSYILSNNYEIFWEKDKESGSLPTKKWNAYVYDPPYEDTWYKITVKDKYNLMRFDSVYYKSIQTKAVINSKYIELYDKKYYPEYYGVYYGKSYYNKLQGDEYPAPAKFIFTAEKSKNVEKFSWKIDNDLDTLFYNINDTFLYEFYFPGKYRVKLTTWSAKPFECEDSAVVEVKLAISVLGGDSLLFPNVFTPNSDGFNGLFKHYQEGTLSDAINKNNLFRTYDVSIYYFSIKIFSRYGTIVHEYRGNIRDWKGWDGKIRNTNIDAPEGVYYWVVDMIQAYEFKEGGKLKAKKFDKKMQSGFVHLYREYKR